MPTLAHTHANSLNRSLGILNRHKAQDHVVARTRSILEKTHLLANWILKHRFKDEAGLLVDELSTLLLRKLSCHVGIEIQFPCQQIRVYKRPTQTRKLCFGAGLDNSMCKK